MKPLKRRKAREMAVQTIYAWQISKNIVISEITRYVVHQNKKYSLDVIYFNQVVFGVINSVHYLDNIIKLHISQTNFRINPVEQSILRLSTHEIMQRIDIPYKVIINEGIELAKIFGSNKSHKFINGVLDKIMYEKNKIKTI
ncbi:transcription antitermination factor NusB [Buchnera aphidicola]|uniref:Transcription antitermination protein NusB n=1 Tax=Buchnera aphidicola (Cinara cf. splendens/pseudotsugae 3390) TaxID=2518980 RepID=A0A451CX01_9GAMM|nr:transcription antitermination factor NusB [Buchnera aphidicola]VFP77869.1 Transcription antitermination protein NusB [Buchnera aphidicola (Cinara cf. splendens/pseudotsugae 3390)]